MQASCVATDVTAAIKNRRYRLKRCNQCVILRTYARNQHLFEVGRGLDLSKNPTKTCRSSDVKLTHLLRSSIVDDFLRDEIGRRRQQQKTQSVGKKKPEVCWLL